MKLLVLAAILIWVPWFIGVRVITSNWRREDRMAQEWRSEVSP
jgi:hypothetical protein